MNFEGLQINKELASQLSSAVNTGRLPHAVIIEGGSEAERLALARSLAKAQVCSCGGEKPCGECDNCTKVRSGFHPDVFEAIANEGETDPLKVNAVRQIRSNAFIYPNEAERRVFILHNMQFANEQAQNALLKILEEPPEYVRFILTCPNSSVLLETIISRTAVYSLGQQLSDSLNAKHDEACAKATAVAAALLTAGEYELLSQAADFEKDIELLVLTLSLLRLIFRDALAIKQNAGSTLLSDSPNEAKALSRSCTVAQLMRLMQAVETLEKSAAQNANKNLLITRFSSLLRAAIDK